VQLIREHRYHVSESAGNLQKLSALLTTSERNPGYEEEMCALLNKQIVASQKLLISFTKFKQQQTQKKAEDKKNNMHDDFLEKMDNFGD